MSATDPMTVEVEFLLLGNYLGEWGSASRFKDLA